MSSWPPRIRLAAITCAVILVCAVAYLLISAVRNGERRSLAVERLVIADAKQPTCVLVYIADAKGYFKDEGLDIEFRTFVLGRDAIVSAIEGKADLATVYETPVVTKIYEGNDLSIVSTLHTSTRGQGVVARRDRGISQPADLSGKRVGVTHGTAEDYFLTVFLATEGIAPTAINRVPLEPEQYESALVGNQVDAIVGFGSYLFDLPAKLGPEKALVFYSDVYVEISMLVGRRETVARRKEAMFRLARAIVRAQDFADSNQQESIIILAKRLGLSEGSARRLWSTFRPEAKLDNVLLTVLVQEGHWLRETGRFGIAPPDFAKALFPDYLRSARPSAVTVLGPPPYR
jgi:NitT/TauT family transport system substrate-binding protein